MKTSTSLVLILFLTVVAVTVPIVIVDRNNEPSALDLNVLVVSPVKSQGVLNHFSVDKRMSVEFGVSLPNDLSIYDTLILLDYVPSSPELSRIQAYGGGVVVFMGPALTANTSLLQILDLSSQSKGEIVASKVGDLPIIPDDVSENPVLKNIAWNSVPTVFNYTNVDLTNPFIRTSATSENPNIPLFGHSSGYKHIAVNIWVTEGRNREFVLWPYFNYLVYVLSCMSSGVSPDSYATWPYSPVPHFKATVFLGATVVAITIITMIGFYISKKYSEQYAIREAELEEISKELPPQSQDWEDVGMHRQLGGFFVQLLVGILIVLPNVVMSALIFPLYVLPSPQAVGFYDFTVNFFQALWLFFDLGTSTVLVVFFNKHRVKRPTYAIRFVQIFIWYQMLSGIVQVFLVSFLGSIFFPHTFLAHLSWVFVTYAFFQWPAFYVVFLYLFQAMNRHDYYQILNLLLYGVFNITVQYVFIVLFRLWLGPNILIGESLAGAIGFSVGNYMVRVSTFLVGLVFFKRLGFSLKTLFRVDFGWQDIKDALKFGFKWTVGNIFPPLGWLFQVFLLSIYLPNYTQQQGYFSLAWNFALIVMIVGLFAQSLLSGVSESYHANKRVLTQYYALSGLKWAAFFDLFFVAALLAVGPRFILGGAGIDWRGAAILMPWLLLFHALGYFSWLGDWMFAGSDRPGMAAISWVIEQTLRAILLFLFIPRYAFFTQRFDSPLVAVMFAYIPALIIKNIYMWWGIRRSEYFQFPWKDWYWQGLIAPLLTAGMFYAVIEGIARIVWKVDIVTSVLLLVIATLPGLYLFAFFSGLFGAFDDKTMAEFERAVYMAGALKFMTIPLFRSARFGARFSPLHNRFPLSIYALAKEEAEELTREKKRLVI